MSAILPIFKLERETEAIRTDFPLSCCLNCVLKPTLNAGEVHRESISLFPVFKVEAGKEGGGGGGFGLGVLNQSTFFANQVSVLLTELRSTSFKDQI